MSQRRDPEAFLRRLRKQDEILVAAGRPAIPPWWWTTIERFEREGRPRRIVRKGRRVFASTCVAPRLGVCEMLWGEHRHVPGTPPLGFDYLSVKRDEAAMRLRGIKDVLDVYGEPYAERGDTIELRNRPAMASVVTANHRTNVGGDVAWAWCDEVDSWNDDELGANPAEQVIGRLAPALATHPNASLWLVSSPLSVNGYHSRQFDRGDTDGQSVAFGNTWTINTSLSEAETHRLEPDDRIWAREYAAIPQAAQLAAFPRELINRGFTPRDPELPHGEEVLILDPSSGGHASRDAFTWCRAAWCFDEFPKHGYLYNADGDIIRHPHNGVAFVQPEFLDWKPRGKPYLRVIEVGSIKGGFSGEITGDQIADRIAEIGNRHRIREVHSDQRESLFLGSAMEKRGFRFHSHTWSNSSKAEAVTLLRRWLADGTLSMPANATELRSELEQFEEVVSPSGALTFGARGRGHDDHVALLITLAHAEANPETRLPRSLLKPTYTYGMAQ